MIFRKLKRVWSHNDINYLPKFRETFPELQKITSDELYERFKNLGLDFYTEEKTNVRPLIRLTLPFALVLMLLMLIWLPFNFLITGNWNYGNGDKSRILNWFRELRLV
ncbi:hypothetical protein P3875_04215 [Myroides sp. JBRI-B21084]|uniref:hypothetical protein n=1 Tax=Myroides sp. JBRI-B21084 TaxID=3119977 RepID=UPI0026E215DE|nr:hypothetical protein [Paenimyroides cloacae]WKW47277.1 hypothetical protein P3875_04215 [Paenimyroides cloacae]